VVQEMGPSVDVPTILECWVMNQAEWEILGERVRQLCAEARGWHTMRLWTQAVLVQSGEAAW
jgi:hypothetical protein